MSRRVLRVSPGGSSLGCAAVLALMFIVVAGSACEDPAAGTSSTADPGTQAATSTTVPATTAGASTTGELTGEEPAAPDDSAASEEPGVSEESAPSEEEDTPEPGTTPTWVFTTEPPPPMVYVGWTRYEEDDSLLHSAYSDGWTDDSWSGASEGHYKYAKRDASVVVRFHGTRIAVVAVKNSACGRAMVQLDGGPPHYIDLNRHGDPATSARVWTSPVLAAGEHTLVFRWAGVYYPPSLATFDAVDVIGRITRSP